MPTVKLDCTPLPFAFSRTATFRIEGGGDDIDSSVSVDIGEGEDHRVICRGILVRSTEGAISVAEEDAHGTEVFVGVHEVHFAVAVDVRRLARDWIRPFEEGEIL